ncbi:hypothetical protein AgCh_012520 [Apium graveolens]
MSNFTKLEFEALDITGKNYLSWILDIEIHLAAQGLGDTIENGNQESESNRTKAMIFLRRHLHEGLKNLISCLLVAEQNNKFLMKNHESRPTGSRPFPEANAAIYNYGRGRGGGHGRGGNRGRGRSFAHGQETCEVQRLIHLQGISNQLPDAFNDINRVTKSHIPAANAPAKIEVPEGQIIKANESRPRMKRGRPIGSKDKNPRKRKGAKYDDAQIDEIKSQGETPEETRDMNNQTLEEDQKIKSSFSIVAVYVDDLNIIGTPEELQKTVDYLKAEFEMKDLGRTNLCLGLQNKHLPNGIFVHQSSYTEKILKRFYMDKSHPFNSPMVVRSLDKKKDVFRPKEENEEILGPEVPYLSAIGALMYLANNTRPDITFSVNLLARHSNAPTWRHWYGVKHIFRYLRGTTDMGLFYSNKSKAVLTGYADAGYLSDPDKARSQTGYLFTYGDTTISWRSVKQSLVATSSNHAEILTIHEASRECVWLRSICQHIRESCGMHHDMTPTVVFEDNAACIEQLKKGYIKGGQTLQRCHAIYLLIPPHSLLALTDRYHQLEPMSGCFINKGN